MRFSATHGCSSFFSGVNLPFRKLPETTRGATAKKDRVARAMVVNDVRAVFGLDGIEGTAGSKTVPGPLLKAEENDNLEEIK